VTFFIAAAILIGLGQPAGIAAVVAVLTAYFAWRRPASMAEVAADLDDRFGLADLLGSAWAVRDSDEPWAASLCLIADAKAATLPPSPWPGRWTIRRSACGLAMAAAVLLAANLIPNQSTAAEPIVHVDVRAQARPNQNLEYATQPRRAADTATSETRLPSEHETAANGQARSEPAQSAANDAKGDGRADSKQKSSIELKSTSKGVTDPGGIAGGNRIAESGPAMSNATGMVRSKPAELPEHFPEHFIAPNETSSKSSTAVRPAAPPPAGYRDLISEFFAR
jgi:hypothetical protein